MLFWTEEYIVSTLVKADFEHVAKTQEVFQNRIKQLFDSNPDYEKRILISKKPRRGYHTIDLGHRTIETWRLEWLIRGDKDILETFLKEWKQTDENPYYSFFVKREYSFSKLKELMMVE